VVFPVFFSWIEEADVAASKRVLKLSLCPLVVITPETAKAQIIKIAGTTLRFRNDVVDREIVPGVVHKRAAILAVIPRSFAHTPSQRR